MVVSLTLRNSNAFVVCLQDDDPSALKGWAGSSRQLICWQKHLAIPRRSCVRCAFIDPRLS